MPDDGAPPRQFSEEPDDPTEARPYDSDEETMQAASVGADLENVHDEAPKPEPEGEGTLERPKPGHEAPDDAF